MPYRDPELKRRSDRIRSARYRARKRAAAPARAEQARLQAEREAALRASQLVPMRLLEDLRFADHEHLRGETIWVVPGLVWQWEKRQLAVEIPQPQPLGVRVIPSNYEPEIVPEEPEEPRLRSGY